MMETKLWIGLCAILVIHLGSATPDSHTTALPSSKLDPVLNPSSTSHSLRITVTTEALKNNVIANTSDANTTKTESTTPVPTHTGATHITQTPFLSTTVTPTPSSHQTVLQPEKVLEKHSQGTALPTTSNPKSEPTKAVFTTITTTTTNKSTTTTNKSNTTKSSTSSTSSSQNPTTSQLTTNTSQSSTTQSNNQANTSNHLPLNAEDTTTGRASLALDPLLAGLVSAFIIAAVIITLLLFLKLRRRGNRPEFHRLQDLPMDDMEDTPLSMYSY